MLLRRYITVLFVLLVLWGSLLMLRLTIPYAAFDRYTDFLMSKQTVYYLLYWRISFYVHVLVSILVLVTGLVQFSKKLRQRYPRWHRNTGKLYIIIILLVSGPTGLVMGFYANGGWPARTSFILLALMWMGATALAWRYALQRKWQQHAHMMTRSYALTLSALTLRGMSWLIAVLHLPLHPVTAYVLIAWLSWTLNAIIGELLIYRKAIARTS